MKRGGPLSRSTHLLARRATPRRSERVRNLDFLSFVHGLVCGASGISGHVCEGAIEADHAGPRPMGRKADDDSCIALCTLAHRQRHDLAGPFRRFDKAQMRAWLDEQISITRAAYALYQSHRTASQVGALTSLHPLP